MAGSQTHGRLIETKNCYYFCKTQLPIAVIGVLRMTKDELREALASYAHEAWSGWMKYLFSKCNEQDASYFDITDQQIHQRITVIPQQLVEHWTRQMNTPYAELSEEEKESDRKEADRILEILKEHSE